MSVASYADEQTRIYEWLKNHWAKAPVAKPNTQFTPPDAGAYVEVRITNQTAFNASIGSTKRVRHPGLLTLIIRGPINAGDGVLKDYADELCAVFRNASVADSIHFRAPTVRDFGPSDGHYEIHVDCPFRRDSVFSD